MKEISGFYFKQEVCRWLVECSVNSVHVLYIAKMNLFSFS